MQQKPNSPENTNSAQQPNQSTGKGSPLDRYTAQPKKEEDQSPYFKSAAPTISLPKGGGALKGIDEKFSVNAVNGTAGLEVGLPLTPGRGGFTPALALSYNSGSGNSEFGLGFGLSLPSIQRKTDKKLPMYDDANESDVFLLAGAEDLVPELDGGARVIIETDDYIIKRYRPRIEGLFARIEFIQPKDRVATWWRVTTKDNITTYYGMSATARITDPESESRIFKWLPEITLDHKGNVQVFEYSVEDKTNIPDKVYERNHINETALFANTYLRRAFYGNKDPYFISTSVFEPALPDTDWLFEAVLDYGDFGDENYTPDPDLDWPSRKDPFSDFHAGFEIRTYRKCRRTLMFHRFDELNGGEATLVRSLELTYANDDAITETETDYILSITQKGYSQKSDDSYVSKALPSMEMEYIPFQWNTDIHSVSSEDFTGAPQGLTGPYQWVDFEGEGISGILTEQGQGWFYKNNLGDGHFDSPKMIAQKPSFTGLGNNLQWQDLEADGRRQVVAQSPVKGFWELDDDQEWEPFRTFAKNLNIDWNSPFTKSLDLNGDGRPDVLITEDRAWTWYANEGKKGYDTGGNARTYSNEEQGPMLLLRDAVQSIFLADMNGDGMTDLVRIQNGEICYWPNKGYGAFGAKVTMGNSPTFLAPDQYNPMYLSLADISGTGAADLIYTGKNKCTAWVNLSGNAWSDHHEINPLPGTDSYSKIAVLDFLGNGTGCIVWSSPLPNHSAAPIQYIDLMGGNKPYLMKKYSNGAGKEVEVTYKNSTQFYLEDKLSGISWVTRLPFPVQCIHTITTRDLVSEATFRQSYKYRHGYYDHEEREYRGFGYVETVDIDEAIVSDVEELDQFPVLTKKWFHTGAWIGEGSLIERFRQEYYKFEEWDDMKVIASFPVGMDAQEQREAYRALKGSPLRQEVYAVDGDPIKKDIPFTVTASAYTVKLIQHLGPNRHASFINLQQESVAFSCERVPDDTRIQHSFNLEADLYGNVLKSAQVAYRRKTIPGTLPEKVQREQEKMHIVSSLTGYTEDAIDNIDYAFYRLRVPCHSEGFEVNVTNVDVGSGKLWRLSDLKGKIDTATIVDFTVTPDEDEKRQLSETKSFFLANDASSQLAFEELESLAIPYQQYQLAFTSDILGQCYGSDLNSTMLSDARYIDLDSDERYWVPSGTAVYDVPEDQFYMPAGFTDPWGNETIVSYWGDYWLLPVSIEDAKSNISSVNQYNWRILQPERMIDLNDNFSEILYDALGMPVAMALKGKDNGTEGDELDGIDPFSSTDISNQQDFWDDPEAVANDLLKKATWRCVYELGASPVAVGMIARQQHYFDTTSPPSTGKLIRISYSDGFGRIMMNKAQCRGTLENGNKEWVGSGRTVYNNKGNAVMQYEPYFSDTHAFDPAIQAAEQGVSAKLHYDALGRVFRTNLPDGSFSRTEWTSWEQTVWDNDDTVLDPGCVWYTERIGGGMGGEEEEAAEKAANLADTPTVMHTDTLARSFFTIQQDAPSTYIHSYVNLDILGNRLSIVDGKRITSDPDTDPLTLQYYYNMLKAPCYQYSIDSGTQTTFLDVSGQPHYAKDANYNTSFFVYDTLRRPIEEWKNGALSGRTVYGEDFSSGDPIDYNLRGQVYDHYNGGGETFFSDGYDFKGNPKQTDRKLFTDKTLTNADWNLSPILDPEIFTQYLQVNALNMPLLVTDPGGNEIEYGYDKAGALISIIVDGKDTYVEDIHYNAKGQRSAIWYGNNTKTGYTYDEFTYRLRRLLTINRTSNVPLQDLNYYYDPVGNITRINDDAQQDIFFANSVVSPSQVFTYDALYRLIQAEGRELIGTATFGAEDNWNDSTWMGSYITDGSAVQNYIQQYSYDAVGNILQLQHIADSGSYTREYYYDDINNNNQLVQTNVNGDNYYYTDYDNRGNMLNMPNMSVMDWNLSNELNHVLTGSVDAWYQYSGGQRVRKYVDKGSEAEERIYLGDFEIYRKFDSSGVLIVKRTTVHISDDAGRIAMIERRTYGSSGDDNHTAETLKRFIYSNHLQSASLELDDRGEIISYEEYHPYGTTSFQEMDARIGACAKRYRYTGKERDEESGLYYQGARYYIPWLGRWTSVDPLDSKYAGMSPYNYSFNNPIKWNDLSGADPTDTTGPTDPPKGDDASDTTDTKDSAKKGDTLTDENGNPLYNADGTPMTASQDEVIITATPFIGSMGGSIMSSLYNGLYESAIDKHGTVAVSFSATGSYGLSVGGGVGFAVDYEGNFAMFYNGGLNALNSDLGSIAFTNQDTELKAGGSLMLNYSVYEDKKVTDMAGGGASIGAGYSRGPAVGASLDYSSSSEGTSYMGYTLSAGIGSPGKSAGVTLSETYMAAFSKQDFRELFLNSWDAIGVKHMDMQNNATNDGNFAAPIGFWNYDGSNITYDPIAPVKGSNASYNVVISQKFHMNTTGFSPKGMRDVRGDRMLQTGIVMNRVNRFLFTSTSLIPSK